MSSRTAPTKTQLGVDELRHRTRRLSQRHRTVLLLVDGQRSLAEVLGLAQQAGATTRHFEELMKLGLVELPLPAEPLPEPLPVPVPADEADLPQVTSVDLLVVAPESMTLAEAGAGPEPEPAPEPEPLPVLIAELPTAEQAWERTIRLLGTPPEPQAETVKPTGPRPLGELPVLNEVDEGAMLQQVRELLIDTLRLDAPLFGARTFVHVRAAQTAAELIELVWEIEQHLSHARHSRRELLSLQRARELLGLGNTLVADESLPGFTPS
ncbi:MAG TPA: hypothetical protein VKI18_12445 [Albitalea sp.]|nr:hypothetical protein [Albitalea sp.]